MTNNLIEKASLSDQSLLDTAGSLKKEADEILEKSGLLGIVSEYGKPRIVGSYALDVMVRPDLDIYVVSESNDREKLEGILERLKERNYFSEIAFVDRLNLEEHEIFRKGSIKGYYFQPKVKVSSGREWKVDLWFMTKDQFRSVTQKFVDLLKDDPKGEKRLAILKLKTAYLSGKKYIKPITGQEVYRAVLEHGVRTQAQFESYLAEKGIKTEA